MDLLSITFIPACLFFWFIFYLFFYFILDAALDERMQALAHRDFPKNSGGEKKTAAGEKRGE